MAWWKVGGLGVLGVLVAIGMYTAIDNEGQLDAVSACARDAGLTVERDDFVVTGRRPVNVPGIDVHRPADGAAVGLVFFYSDDFEAEKARPQWEDADARVEQLENVLLVTDEPEPEGIGPVRGCVREMLADGD